MGLFAEHEYQQIIDFIKEKGVASQPDIIKHFTREWFHDIRDTNSRMKIGYRLKRLEELGLLEKRSQHKDKGIPTNFWRVKDDRPVSEVSHKIPEAQRG